MSTIVELIHRSVCYDSIEECLDEHRQCVKAAEAIAAYNTITTVDELTDLPGQSVIRDSRGHVFEVELHETQHRTFWATQHWTGYGGDFGYKAEDVTLPATVLYIHEEA
jgi:hypothetical protein